MTLAHGPSITTESLALYLDIENTRSYPGSGTTVNDLSMNRIEHSLVGASLTTVQGVRCFNCSVSLNYLERTSITYTVPASYTMISWALPLPDASVTNWRTLWRSNSGQHPLLIQNDTNIAGMWISGAFRSFGYNIGTAGLENRWAMWTIAGTGGSTSLYIDDQDTGASIAFTADGSTHRWIGGFTSGQPWGYVSTAMIYGRRLSTDEIASIFNATRGRYRV